MSQKRRDFLKNAAVLSGAAGLSNVLPSSISKAFSINPEKGTTFYDAEHIVFLMQENRSFDHIFGCMKGVRGFNDPRIKILPDKNKAWIQKSKTGAAHAPFHIDINKTKVTWQGGLPHAWPDQSRARNDGKYDRWIPQKSEMCMGYFNRADVPFYYAMADAFTLCDHYFCSSLTGTTPNRLFFWTGKIREQLNAASTPAVNNSQAESRNNTYVDWSSFPALLEDNDISWKIYQNELWTAQLDDHTDYWLGNYGDNAIEYVKQHRVKLASYFRQNGDKTATPALSAEEVLERYEQLSQKEKNLIDKAFACNSEVADYLKLHPYTFKNDKGEEETVTIPAEDIFHQFRKDVDSGNLPTVSWLVAPQAFSDHTSTPLYGTWYVSEALNILTQNPEVWKKTIFILNYDENDGYYDHLPPFVVPHPNQPQSGKVSAGINIESDYDYKENWPIGLGYRVPMIIASPWSKGGFINSQVHDHTSTLMFLEKFLSKKTGKKIRTENISSWRRAVCGDFSSAFRPYNGEELPLPEFEKQKDVIHNIQNAKHKPKQAVPEPLTSGEIEKINRYESFAQEASKWMPEQEKGVRPACALPYRLHADAQFNKADGLLTLSFEVENNELAAGSPFNMYTPDLFAGEPGKTWFYAVKANDRVTDALRVADFEQGVYHVCIDGPNGFHRQMRGTAADPGLKLKCRYESKSFPSKKYTGNLILELESEDKTAITVALKDNAYQTQSKAIQLSPGKKQSIKIDLGKSSGWYDFTLSVEGNNDFSRRYAGHVETGAVSTTDPFMGGVL
ncbi:phosphocholine-specific phospholipase C [Niabella insulamsoli]|uniref:phosphocholine-specific phospholipase C n=1 Tax=Niabella insulamsoli TaxID=3144874 RepID=UPI0031FC87A0